MDWHESYDIVVIGSGGGGIVAGLAARAHGKSVVVLESTEKLGGSTGMSGGILWVPNHPLQAAAGVEDSLEAGQAYLDALTAEDTTPFAAQRRRRFLEAGPRVVDFLIAQGIPMRRCDGWSDYHDEMPGSCARSRSLRTDLFNKRELGKWESRFRTSAFPYPMRWPELQQAQLFKRSLRSMLYGARVLARTYLTKLTGKRLAGSGGALQGRLLKAAVHSGVTLQVETPVTDLVVIDGTVKGVTVGWGDAVRSIEARIAVVIAAGGFARNQEMREAHLPAPSRADWSLTNPGDDGSMIKIASAKGAATSFMPNAIWNPASKLPIGANVFHLQDVAKPHCILVDSEGKRFTNEASSYMALGQDMYSGRAAPAWAILDSRHRSRYPWGMTFPGEPPAQWLETGYMRRAKSLADLAIACGIDPAGLINTAERFNGFAITGRDEDYHRGERAYDRVFADPTNKPNPSLGAIERAPFYAVQVFPGDVGTVGGIVTDENARVIDRDGVAIRGLYAAGNCAAPLFGMAYPGAGASIAATCVFAHVAVEDALSRSI